MTPQIIDLGTKRVIVTADPRSSYVWVQFEAFGGKLGLPFTAKQAAELNCALTAGIREIKGVSR